jgi:hypothetical protein
VTTKADNYARHCEAVRDDGGQCRAFAKRDSDPPRCDFHSISKEERVARSVKGGKRRQMLRREAAEPKARSGLSPTVSLEDVLRAVAPALTATFEHNGSADWSARLAAAGTLLTAFPRHLRDTPENVRELLERCLPLSVLEQREMRKRLEAEEVYRAMRDEWIRLQGMSWDELTGLYWEPFPRYMVAPWEDYKTVCMNELPSAIVPDKAPVNVLEDGTVLLRRPGERPLVIEAG